MEWFTLFSPFTIKIINMSHYCWLFYKLYCRVLAFWMHFSSHLGSHWSLIHHNKYTFLCSANWFLNCMKTELKSIAPSKENSKHLNHSTLWNTVYMIVNNSSFVVCFMLCSVYLVTVFDRTPKILNLIFNADQQLLKQGLIQPVTGSQLAVLWLCEIQTWCIRQLTFSSTVAEIYILNIFSSPILFLMFNFVN